MKFILEHVNLRVPSIQRTQKFLAAAFPHFTERGTGYSKTFGYWSHFGDDQTYFALQQIEAPGEEPDITIAPFKASDRFRLLHIGLEVDDIDALMSRLEAHGYSPSDAESLDSHPWRRRVYYLDGNNMEWEFVQYLSDEPEQRNDYLV
jgi:catechol 2,3-dioxygenase-like lactoylglutathione lyase family enzyme